MNWNIRGINSQERWDDIGNKITESNCNVICLQETKTDHFDSNNLRKFYPRRLNQFAYQHSVGNSGGILTIWNGHYFAGRVISQNSFQLTVELKCNFSNKIWYITNVYAPCSNEGRTEFVDWFLKLDSTIFELWIIMGDLI